MNSEELLAIFDAEGRPLGVKTRRQVHADHDWHWLVFVWAARWDEAGQIQVLLQVRARPGDPHVGSVDAPAGGHVAAGETHGAGAQREFGEEVGVVLREEELVYLGQRALENATGSCRRVFQHFYLCTRPISLEEARCSEESRGFVEVELEELAGLVEGTRAAISGCGWFAGEAAMRQVELTPAALASYSAEILASFGFSLAGIRRHLEAM